MLCFWKRFEAKQFCKFIGPMYNNSHFVCYVLLLQNNCQILTYNKIQNMIDL